MTSDLDDIRLMAEGLEWYESTSGDPENAHLSVMWDDGTSASGMVTAIHRAHLGAFRDRATIFGFGDGHRITFGGLTSGSTLPWCRVGGTQYNVGRLVKAAAVTVRLDGETMVWRAP